MEATFVSSAVLAAAVTVLAAPSSAQRIGLATPPLPDEPTRALTLTDEDEGALLRIEPVE